MGEPADDATSALIREPSVVDAIIPLVSLAGLIATLLYLPYAVFCYASPALSVLYGITGFKIEKIETSKSREEST